MLSRCPPLQVVRNRKCVVPFVELNSGDKASYIWDFLLMLHQLPSLFQLPGYVMTLQIQTGQDPAHNQSVAILLQSHNPYLPDVTDYSTASTLKFLGPDQQCDTIQITNLSGSFFFFFFAFASWGCFNAPIQVKKEKCNAGRCKEVGTSHAAFPKETQVHNYYLVLWICVTMDC